MNKISARVEAVERRLDKRTGLTALWGAVAGALAAFGSLLYALFSGLITLKGGGG